MASSETKWHYIAQINEKEIPNCPPAHYQTINQVLYRWVFKDRYEDSFVPASSKEPERFIKSDDLNKCKSWGLSFFDSLDTANKRYKNLATKVPNISLEFGDQIAEIQITATMGKAGDQAHGHITFHPFEGAQFVYLELTPLSP